MYEYWYPDYLMHYGVKGMKWGRRRYTNADGSLNARGVKKYARAGYTQDSYNSNKTKLGKAYDKITGAHKFGGDITYSLSSEKERKARAEKYIADRNSPEVKAAREQKIKKAAKVGKVAVGTALVAYGAYKLYETQKYRDRGREYMMSYARSQDRLIKKAANDIYNSHRRTFGY